MQEYNYLEFGCKKDGIFRRNMWITNSEVPTYRDEYNNTDVYVTVWNYTQPDQNSSHTAPLYFDLDKEGDLPTALRDTLSICDVLTSMFYIPHSFINIRFSGHKGFHVTVDEFIFGLSDSIDKSKLWKHVATKFSESIISIDKGMYDTRRLFRLLNSINSKSGLYKIPLTYSDIKCQDIDNILQKAKTSIEPKPTVPNICFVEQAHIKMLELLGEINRKSGNFVKPPCIKTIEKGARKGERNKTLFTLAVYYKSMNFERDKIFSILANWNKKNSPMISNSEIGKTLNSVMVNEYSIGCSTPELQEYCDKENCPIERSKL